jgi:predicted SprT family Zn-dependent metalloprotease
LVLYRVEEAAPVALAAAMDEAICKICGAEREKISRATKRKKLPAYFCFECDGNLKPNLSDAPAIAEDESALD